MRTNNVGKAREWSHSMKVDKGFLLGLDTPRAEGEAVPKPIIPSLWSVEL